MFKLSQKDDVNILKCDYIRCSASEISNNSQIYINIPRRVAVNRFTGSLPRLDAGVLHAATNNRYIVGDDIRLVKEVPIALFSKYKVQSSSGKHIEEINHAHIFVYCINL